MAKIDTPQPVGVDVSSVQHVSQSAGTAGVADVFAPQALEVIAQGAAKIFTEVKKDKAETAAKSLLDEFTGSSQLLDIAEREGAVLEDEEGVASQFAGMQPDDPRYEDTKMRFETIQGMKSKLEKEREAVVQGLMTNDQYRKRAEMSFYQQVALSPGLKDELAAVMGEHLGIDPRGQTAKMTMEARKAGSTAEAAHLKTMNNALIKEGYWDNNQTPEANRARYWDILSKELQASHNLQQMTEKLNAQTKIDEAEQTAAAENTRKWVPEAERQALNSMASFEGQNIWNISPSDFINMDQEFKQRWIMHIQQNSTEFSGILNTLDSTTNGKYSSDKNVETLNNHAAQLISILQSEQYDENLTNLHSIGKLQNDIVLEAKKAGIIMTQPKAVLLSAYSRLGINISNMISANIAGSQMVTEGLLGEVPNLEKLNATDLKATNKMYEKSLAAAATAYADDPNGFDGAAINNMGNVAAMVAKQDPDFIKGEARMQLNRLVAQEGFLEKLEALNPKQARQIREGVITHQRGLGQTYNAEVIATTELHTEGRLKPLDFHLEQVEGQWMAVINSDVDNAQVSSVVKLGGLFADTNKDRLKRKTNNDAEEIRAEVTARLNRTRGFINNFVMSKANATGMTPKEAAKLVAQDMGISLTDGAMERPGFAEELGLKNKTDEKKDTRSDIDRQSDENAAAVKERNEGTEPTALADGVYEYPDGSGVFQVKNGELVSG